MAQGIVRVYGPEKPRTPVVAANNEVFVDGAYVSKDSAGLLIVATAGTKIYGIVRETVTAIAANATFTTPQNVNPSVAGYTPLVIDGDNVDSFMTADQAWAQTDNDAYADIAAVTAGVQSLNLAAGATGQFAVQGLLSQFDGNPANDGNTTNTVIKVAEPQDMGFAQS